MNHPASNRDVSAKDNVRGAEPDQKIDYAKLETERLERDHAGLAATFKRLKSEGAAIPRPFDKVTALQAGGIIKAARDLSNTMESIRKVEVEPHLRRQNSINTFFGGFTEAIQPENKNKRLTSPGLIDELQAEINAHQDRVEAEVRAQQAQEAADRARIAREAQEAADRAAEADRKATREAQEAADRIARAKSDETRAQRQAEADAAARIANEQAAAAKKAEVDARTANERHEDAHIATLSMSKDIVHAKGQTAEGGGVTLTKTTEKIARVLDRSKIPAASKAVLFDLLTDVEVDKAVRSYAVKTSYMAEIPGCLITVRQTGVTR